MAERLPANLEAAAIMRRVEVDGGFAMMLRKGDPDRGAIALIINQKGQFQGILERELGQNFDYEWTFKPAPHGPGSMNLGELTALRERFDADSWLIELDIADPERFIAETTRLG